MITVENSPCRSERLANEYHITFIFNSHKGAKEASQTLGFIPEKSVVFTEGYIDEHEWAAQRYPLLLDIARDRLQSGHYDELSRSKFALSNLVIENREKVGRDEYDEHTLILLNGLTDKECVILPADFINIEDENLSRFDIFRNPRVPDLSSLDSPWQRAIALARMDKERFLANEEYEEYREFCACQMVENLLTALSPASGNNILKDDVGKTKVFVIFGSGHQVTLSQKMRQQIPGIPIEDINLYQFKPGERPRHVPIDHVSAFYSSLVRHFMDEICHSAE